MTTPDLLKQWYGPEAGRWSSARSICGSAAHFVVQRPDGKRIGQRGVCQTIDARLDEVLASIQA